MKKNQPVISIDTKKKEYMGNFYREGLSYTRDEIRASVHDFGSFSDEIAIPHGIYDLNSDTGYISIGISKDTGEFACDSIRNWWYGQGKYQYCQATGLLILCDGGGSNSSRQYLFKEDLTRLAEEIGIGIGIRVAHYPPYTSKYNPMEHRLFQNVTRACKGVVFKNLEIVKELIEKNKTKNGLKVTVRIIDKLYRTGRKVSEDFKNNMRIVFDEYLPQWNYRAVPLKVQNAQVN